MIEIARVIDLGSDDYSDWIRSQAISRSRRRRAQQQSHINDDELLRSIISRPR